MSNRDIGQRVSTPEELLAHASKMERSAAIRYAELADQMEVHNNPELAEFLREMSRIEWGHVNDIDQLSGGINTEGASTKDRWSVLSGGEAPDYGDMHYLSQPHHVLKLALDFEITNAKYYSEVAQKTEDTELQELAKRLQAEEEHHVAELESWLVRYPEPDPDWDEDMDAPVCQE